MKIRKIVHGQFPAYPQRLSGTALVPNTVERRLATHQLFRKSEYTKISRPSSRPKVPGLRVEKPLHIIYNKYAPKRQCMPLLVYTSVIKSTTQRQNMP
jgi:hypothetical protein